MIKLEARDLFAKFPGERERARRGWGEEGEEEERGREKINQKRKVGGEETELEKERRNREVIA